LTAGSKDSGLTEWANTHEDLLGFLKSQGQSETIDTIRIGLGVTRYDSFIGPYGEVKTGNSLTYRTFKQNVTFVLCQIFGPIKD